MSNESNNVTKLPQKSDRPKLKPIDEALQRAGLVRNATGMVHQSTSTASSHALARIGDDHARQPVVYRNDGSVVPPKDGASTLVLKEIDPDDIPNERGFTPRMQRWLAEPGIHDLVDILMYCRPKGSQAEADMVRKHIYGLLDTEEGILMHEDIQGNIVVDVGDNPHGVLWSCHTDSVHDAAFNRRQNIVLTTEGFLRLAQSEWANCLGADDGTGIWLMREMIKGKVGGRYVFHYGEESGCIGSNWLRKFRPDLLEGIRFAVAFDRNGYNDIITHQRGSRCASEAFAASLAAQLPGNYKSEHGIWTDTAVYTDIVAECTNLSVGYFGAHGSGERQSVPHAIALREAMLKIDPSKWVCERKPGPPDYGTPRRTQTVHRSHVRRTPHGVSRLSDAQLAEIDDLYGLDTRRGQKALKRAIQRQAQKDLDETFKDSKVSNSNRLEDGFPKRGRDVAKSREQQLLDEEEAAYAAQEEAYEAKQLEKFRPDSPSKPRSMEELVAGYGREVADHLEQDGFTVMDFWPGILSALGYRKQ